MRLPDREKSRAVLGGTDVYHHLPALRGVHDGAAALRAALTDPQYGSMSPEHCVLLTATASPKEVGEAIVTAAEEAEDLLLIYFAGHGVRGGRRGELHLAVADTHPDRPGIGGLPFDAVRDIYLGFGANARAKIVILDCCFSGQAVGLNQSAVDDRVLGDQVAIEGTVTLTSSTANAVSKILDGEPHPAYTTRLLRMLREGVPGGPELLTVPVLHGQLERDLKAAGLSRPLVRQGGLLDQLGLVRNRAWVEPPVVPEDPPPTESARPAAPIPPDRPVVAATRPDLVEVLDNLETTVRRRYDSKTPRIGDPDFLPVRWRFRSSATGIPVLSETAEDHGFDQIAPFATRPDATGRLVVLGGPGAGKTTLVEQLTADLLRGGAPGDPIPVPLMASTWDPRTRRLRDWVVDHLTHKSFALTKESGKSWRALATALYDSGKILPILDGFDELPRLLRERAFADLNHRRIASVVLTCRTGEYPHTAGSGLRDADVVELQPLDLGDAEAYLRRTTFVNWDLVFTSARAPHSPLARTLAVPVMVRLARSLYSPPDAPRFRTRDSSRRTRFATSPPPRVPDELTHLVDQVAIENHLLTALIPAAYPDDPDVVPEWPAAKARRWLEFLRHHVDEAPGAQGHTIAWWELALAVRPLLFGLSGAVLSLLFFPLSLTTPGTVLDHVVSTLVAAALFGTVAAGLRKVAGNSPPLPLYNTDPTRKRWRWVADAVGAESGSLLFRKSRASFVKFCVVVVLCDGILAISLGRIGEFSGGALGSLLGVACLFGWARFVTATFWLAITRKMPWRAMAFLDDAHRRGVLRRVGPSYEFRYHVPRHDFIPNFLAHGPFQ